MTDPKTTPAADEALTVEEAERMLLEHIEQCEGLPEAAVVELVILYSRTGRQDAAAEWVRRLLAATDDREEQAAWLLRLGQLSEQVDDYGAALAYYTQTMELDPQDAALRYFAHNNLGYCLNRFSRYEEAEPHCRKAIQLDSERHNAHKNLGASLEGQAQYAEAAECYIRAVLRYPPDMRALQHLEALLQDHPEVSRELPEIEAWLSECRGAVSEANRAH